VNVIKSGIIYKH